MTFATKNIFVPAACHLARGGTMEIIGTEIPDFEVQKMEFWRWDFFQKPPKIQIKKVLYD